MALKMQPTSVIKARLGIEPNGRVHKYFTEECARYMDRYVPFDTGALAETVIVGGQPTSNVTTNTITYDQQYAKIVYYGIRNGKSINIHTDKHIDATTYWDKRMWSVHKDDIIKSVQEYLNRGGRE